MKKSGRRSCPRNENLPHPASPAGASAVVQLDGSLAVPRPRPGRGCRGIHHELGARTPEGPRIGADHPSGHAATARSRGGGGGGGAPLFFHALADETARVPA